MASTNRITSREIRRKKAQRIRGIFVSFAVVVCGGSLCRSNPGALAFSSDQVTTHLESRTPKTSHSTTAPSLSFSSSQSHYPIIVYRRPLILTTTTTTTTTCLHMASSSNSGKNDSNNNNSEKKGPKKNNNKQNKRNKNNNHGKNSTISKTERDLLTRVTNLEQLVSKQEVEIRHLRQECNSLTEAAAAFARIVALLQKAGLSETTDNKGPIVDENKSLGKKETKSPSDTVEKEEKVYEYFDDNEIFGTAPSSVIDAADSAGAAILAGLLGGKQRMLVDVRDAELSRDQDVLVQFIELAILPVAAGLEGLKSTRNRVKIVFPTVSQLLQYRRTMALAAPEVVALSTLGFDPVEEQDNLVVLIAPAPDDEDGLMAMNELLFPTDPSKTPISQPTVVLNHHMVPISGDVASFEVAYHLRLLNVQYMTGDKGPEYFTKWEDEMKEKIKKNPGDESDKDENKTLESSSNEKTSEEDEALEAAMKHAHELGMQQGVTRAMVIRAYPRPWHVFVDTSPDTDADFEVAATFDEEPSQDDVNFAIVECLEGSEREDELVAQQMQQALEDGQLDQVSDMLGTSTEYEVEEGSDKESLSPEDKDKEDNNDDDDSNDNFYNDFDFFGEDSC